MDWPKVEAVRDKECVKIAFLQSSRLNIRVATDKNCSVCMMSLAGSEKDDFQGSLNCFAMWQTRFPETVNLRQGDLPFLWQHR